MTVKVDLLLALKGGVAASIVQGTHTQSVWPGASFFSTPYPCAHHQALVLSVDRRWSENQCHMNSFHSDSVLSRLTPAV